MAQQKAVVSKKPQVPVPALAEAFSGLFGGLFSSTCTYPLDVIKTRMQVPGSTITGTVDGLQTLYREGGIPAMYVGLDSEYAKTALQNFSYFYWYSFLKTYYLRLYNSWRRRQHNARFHSNSHNHSHGPVQSSPPPHPPRADEEIIEDDACSVDELIPENPTPPGLPRPRTAQRMGIREGPASPAHSPTPLYVHQHHYKDVTSISLIPNLLIGCLAGALAQLLVNPVTVVQTRMMTAKKKSAAGGAAAAPEGLVGTFNSIIKNEGFFTLYDGFIPSMILTTNPSIQFLVFDKLKAAWLRHLSTRSPPRYECNAAEVFVIGAIAKIVATLSTYPYIMAKTRLQMKIDGQAKYTGTLDVIKRQLLEQGLFGLYVGLSTQILKSVAGSATLFMAKEKILGFTLRLFDTFKIGGYTAS